MNKKYRIPWCGTLLGMCASLITFYFHAGQIVEPDRLTRIIISIAFVFAGQMFELIMRKD